MDDWAVCVGLGCRRTVTARALRLVTGFFWGCVRQLRATDAPQSVVKKNRALRGSAAHLPTSLVCLKSRILRLLSEWWVIACRQDERSVQDAGTWS